MQLRRWIAINLVLLTAFAQVTAAQSTDAGRKVFTLQEAVNFALKNYPAVRAAMERTSAAEAGIGLARTNYLPRADMLWQGNRASRNNILGLLLPNSTIPSVSGPVLPTTSGRGAWGRAALADILAVADGNVEVQEGSLVSTLPQGAPSEKGVTAHPLAAAQQGRVQEVKSELRVLEHSYYPKFNFQAAAYGRGSGANT